MAATVRTFDGSGMDSRFVWWEPGQMTKEAMADSLDAIGCKHLMPNRNTEMQSLRFTLNKLLDDAKIKRRGEPIELTPLRDGVKGFEAVRVIRGEVDNERHHLISVVLSGWNVVIVKHNEDELPIQSGMALIEASLTDTYQQQESVLPTDATSAVLQRVILRGLNGIQCRKAGIVYFCPESGVERVEQLATLIDTHGLNGLTLTTSKSEIHANERTYRIVLESFQRECTESLMQIETELSEMTRKPHANGTATRLNRLNEMKDKVGEYERLLGNSMTDLRSAVAKVEDAVNVSAVMDCMA
jgi:hypothetical protein